MTSFTYHQLRHLTRRDKRQAGFTLIEVLVAALVLSVGLLGLAGLQVFALKTNDSAYLRSKATLYAYDMMDRMRTNREAAKADTYDKTLGAFSTLAAPAANASIAVKDRYDWYRKLDADLPSAQASIDCNASAVCTITVQWDDARAEISSSAVPKQVIVAGQL
jgi:type IV pilus assembly protein PilV